MQKKISIPIAAFLSALLLTACGEEQPLLTAADYELNQENNETSRGVGIGDAPETFLEAYGEYDMETAVNGGDYQPLAAEEIPFSDSIDTILPTFFIDGQPVTIETLCLENEIEQSALLTLLNSDAYLQEHTVLYRYLVFHWENGITTDIRSESMDYNAEAAYIR